MSNENNFNDAKRHITDNLDALLNRIRRVSGDEIVSVCVEDLREHPNGNLGVMISYLETKNDTTSISYAIYDQWSIVTFSDQWDKSCWNESKILFDPSDYHLNR